MRWPPRVASVECKGVTSGLYRRVFLPEDFRIYTDGRGGLAKSELAHVEVIVMPCVLHPTSLRTEQLWERSRRKVQRRVPSAAVLCRALLYPNMVPSRSFVKAPDPFPGTAGNQARGVQTSMWLVPCGGRSAAPSQWCCRGAGVWAQPLADTAMQAISSPVIELDLQCVGSGCLGGCGCCQANGHITQPAQRLGGQPR